MQNCFTLYRETIGDSSFFIKRSHIFVKDAIHRTGNRFRFSSARRNSAFVTMRVSLLSHRGNTIHENFTNFVFVRRNNTKLEREYCTSLNVAFETSPFSSDSKESDFSEKIVQRKEYLSEEKFLKNFFHFFHTT